jgi:hypothetical protein
MEQGTRNVSDDAWNCGWCPKGTTWTTLPAHFTRLPVMSMTFVSWPSLPAPIMYISKR